MKSNRSKFKQWLGRLIKGSTGSHDLATSTGNSEQLNITDETRITTFLLYTKPKGKHRIADYLFTVGAKKVAYHASDHPIFLTQSDAIYYAKFLTEAHLIFKVSLPESAIASDANNLYLKTGYQKYLKLLGYHKSDGKSYQFIKETDIQKEWT